MQDQQTNNNVSNDDDSATSVPSQEKADRAQPWWRRVMHVLLTPVFTPSFPRGPSQRPLIGYVVAILLQALALFCIFLLTRVSPGMHFLGGLLLLAIPLAALGWGTGPSMLAAFSGTALYAYLLLNHYFFPTAIRAQDGIDIFLYLIIALTITLLASQMQNTRYRAAIETNRLQQYYEELVAQLLTERAARQASEQKSQAQERQLEAILEITSDALFILDTQGAPPRMSRAANNLSCFPLAAEISSTVQHPFDQLNAASNLSPSTVWPETPSYNDKRLYEKHVFDVLVRARDGQPRSITVTSMPVRGADGALIGTILVCRDASEHCTLEQ